MNPDQLAKMQAGAVAAKEARSGKSAVELLRDAKLDLMPHQRAQVEERALEMPETCLRTFFKALRGKSREAGVKAFCQMCLGWEEYRKGINECTDMACPLYPYRPYS